MALFRSNITVLDAKFYHSFTILFMLIELDKNIMGIGTKVVTTLESFDHKCSRGIVPKIVKAQLHELLLCEIFVGTQRQVQSTSR